MVIKTESWDSLQNGCSRNADFKSVQFFGELVWFCYFQHFLQSLFLRYFTNFWRKFVGLSWKESLLCTQEILVWFHMACDMWPWIYMFLEKSKKLNHKLLQIFQEQSKYFENIIEHFFFTLTQNRLKIQDALYIFCFRL
jgi:hypothetical protein